MDKGQCGGLSSPPPAGDLLSLEFVGVEGLTRWPALGRVSALEGARVTVPPACPGQSHFWAECPRAMTNTASTSRTNPLWPGWQSLRSSEQKRIRRGSRRPPPFSSLHKYDAFTRIGMCLAWASGAEEEAVSPWCGNSPLWRV